MRYRILTAADLVELVPSDWRRLVVMPWLAALGARAHELHPYPWLREIDGLGLVVDVAATRWVFGRPPEVCYPVAGVGSTGALQTTGDDGRQVPVYAWRLPPVEVPTGLIDYSGWAVTDRLLYRQAGTPVSPPRSPVAGPKRRW